MKNALRQIDKHKTEFFFVKFLDQTDAGKVKLHLSKSFNQHHHRSAGHKMIYVTTRTQT